MLHQWPLGLKLILVSWQSAHRWLSHQPGGRLPLLSIRPAVTFPAKEHHCHLGRYQITLLSDRGTQTQGHCAVVPSQDSNPRPVNGKSNIQPITSPHHLLLLQVTRLFSMSWCLPVWYCILYYSLGTFNCNQILLFFCTLPRMPPANS